LVWTIGWHEKALKELKKLDKSIQIKILKFLNDRISKQGNPRVFGKPLSAESQGLWRYRIEDFRIICQIKDKAVEVLVVKLGHRRKIYRP
jgi:mRNA interferase RelE/StbE